MQTGQYIELPIDQVQVILNYLKRQPWEDVHPSMVILIGAMQKPLVRLQKEPDLTQPQPAQEAEA